jgi:hypothetical protein
MAEDKISLDQLLQRQEKSSALRATIESIDGNNDVVKITPYVANVGCLCSFAINIPKKFIKTVSPTGENHICCGKQLIVVSIEFTDDGKAYSDIMSQLQSNAGNGTHSHSHHPPQQNTAQLLAPTWMPAHSPQFQQGGLHPSLVCPFGYDACIGACGQGCYKPSAGDSCSNGQICPFAYYQCGCSCYKPSAGETCHMGTVVRGGYSMGRQY